VGISKEERRRWGERENEIKKKKDMWYIYGEKEGRKGGKEKMKSK
jgi:hypothetical protein